jgi:putative PIG3 family NAD(P)H quinone oxidoreductase
VHSTPIAQDIGLIDVRRFFRTLTIVRAIHFDQPGDPDVLSLREVADPVVGPDDLLVRVRATALNRADSLQRRGKYPPPPGASPLLGLEMAGEVVNGGHGFRAGERVCALLPGGGYAEKVAIPAAMAMRVPDTLSWEEAAAFPEVWMTAFDNLCNWGRLAPGELALVHGGGSGVGTAAIQLAGFRGAHAITTVGSAEKARRCRELGAEAIDYHTEDFALRARELSGGRGVDVILDIMGASYFERNLKALAVGGRLVCIGTMGGAKTELDLLQLLIKRATVVGTTLRARSLAEKVALTRQVEREVLPAIADGRMKIVIDQVYPLAEAADAHRRLEASEHFGKIVLRVP